MDVVELAAQHGRHLAGDVCVLLCDLGILDPILGNELISHLAKFLVIFLFGLIRIREELLLEEVGGDWQDGEEHAMGA